VTDQYGLTARVRGDLSDEWFALTGRLVHVTALVEEQVLVLCSVLSGRQLIDVQRERVTEAISRCRSTMTTLPADDQSVIASWIDGVSTLRSYRHDIVHGLWPNETFSHRSPMSKHGGTESGSDGRVVVVQHSVERLQEEVLRGVALVVRGNEMAARAQSPRLATDVV